MKIIFDRDFFLKFIILILLFGLNGCVKSDLHNLDSNDSQIEQVKVEFSKRKELNDLNDSQNISFRQSLKRNVNWINQ
ncbi:hypothetical protein ACS126_18925 [Sphingobacterium lactis]|uniref:hypothetical protein n=1 Tax=Sphingobacterium lactis TaxID=797291 RepID=UPI003EC9326C